MFSNREKLPRVTIAIKDPDGDFEAGLQQSKIRKELMYNFISVHAQVMYVCMQINVGLVVVLLQLIHEILQKKKRIYASYIEILIW